MMKSKILILSLLLTILMSGCSENCDSSSESAELEKLKALPYLEYTAKEVDTVQSGVTIYNSDLACNGYNLHGHVLMDMEGNIVHSWKGSYINILDNGDIIARYMDKIGRYDQDLKPVWESDFEIHHEIFLTDHNTVLTLTSDVHKYNNKKVSFDVILELTLDGEEVDRWSTYENLDNIKKFHRPSKLEKPAEVYDSENLYDYYHLNSVQALPETPLGKEDSRFQKGNWLIDIPFFNVVAVLDKKTKEIVWTWGPGEISMQHMPRMLENGNILIFDNGKHVRDYSRVIEPDPAKKEIVWEYNANPPESFFSAECGSAQRLQNGNTLIMESDNGRAFEVTIEGEIVWEWYNPKMKDGKRKTLYRMIRVSREKINKIIAKYKKQSQPQISMLSPLLLKSYHRNGFLKLSGA